MSRRLLSGTTVPVLLVVAAIIALWYAAVVPMNAPFARQLASGPLSAVDLVEATMNQDRPVLPAPHQVLAALKTSLIDADPASPRSLVYHGWVTLASTLAGFAMGVVLGIMLAVAIVHSTPLAKSMMPWIVASQTVPILAVAPIVIVALGSQGITGLVPKAVISAYLSFFPVAIGMVKGLTSPDAMSLDLMRTYGASPAQTFAKLRWPSAMPFLFASLKVAIAISLVGAIVGEMPTGAQAGLGARLLSGSYYGQTTQIWAALIVAGVLASCLVFAVAAAERVTFRLMGTRP